MRARARAVDSRPVALTVTMLNQRESLVDDADVAARVLAGEVIAVGGDRVRAHAARAQADRELVPSAQGAVETQLPRRVHLAAHPFEQPLGASHVARGPGSIASRISSSRARSSPM